MKQGGLQGRGNTQILTAWTLGSLVSAHREVQMLCRCPENRVCLNELAVTLHTARCYAAMAGLHHVRVLAETLEDDVCARRHAGEPLTPEWLSRLERQVEALELDLKEGEASEAPALAP